MLTNVTEVTKVFGGSFFSPFVRVRAPEFERTHKISQTEWLTFLDGLNEAFIANPALQAADGVGNLLGFVPLASAQILGGSLNAVAGFGTVGVSKMRTRSYIKKANLEFFNPKGLHVQVLKTDPMLKVIGVEKTDDLFKPIAPMHPDAPPMPQGGPSYSSYQYTPVPEPDIKKVIKDRMTAFGDNVVELSFDNVAPPTEQNNWMKKMSQNAAAKAEKEQLMKLHGISDRGDVEKEQAKVDKLRRKMDEVNMRLTRMPPGTKDYRKKQEDLRKDMGDLKKDLRDAEHDLRKELDKAEEEDEKMRAKQRKKGPEKTAKKQAKEVSGQRWLVIGDKERFETKDEGDVSDGEGDSKKAEPRKSSDAGSVASNEKKYKHWWSTKAS